MRENEQDGDDARYSFQEIVEVVAGRSEIASIVGRRGAVVDKIRSEETGTWTYSVHILNTGISWYLRESELVTTGLSMARGHVHGGSSETVPTDTKVNRLPGWNSACGIVDVRLEPWLELADELERFVTFMHAAGMVPQQMTSSGERELVDVGESAVKRMRDAAAARWRFFFWKRWGMEGAFSPTLHTLYRHMAEGAFYPFDPSPQHDEMMRRLSSMSTKLRALMP